MRNIAVLAVAALLAGCGATTPTIKTEVIQVDKIVRAPCIDKAPEKPVYRVGRDAALDGKGKAEALIRDFEAAEQYGTAWEAAASGCIKPTPPQNSLPSTATLQ